MLIRELLFCLAALCLVAGRPALAAGGLEYVTVQAEGTGMTVGNATASALAAAVTQVNGAALASSTISAEVRAAIDTDTASSFAAASASAEVVAQQTKGVVRDYRVLAKSQDGPLWVVSVEARIARYAKSAQADRLRLSIIPFRTTRDGQSPIRDRFVNELAGALTQSRKFAILDRQFETERQAEMAINSSADAPVEELAKLGNRLGTDYMIVGVIEDASVATRSVELAGRVLKSHTGRFSVSYRVIDAPTGQVKFSDSWSRSAEGAAMDVLATQAAEAIGRQIVDAIFPVMVESVSGDILFLGQGGKSIRVGQRYRLLRLGREVADSHTGESLGREEVEVGMIEIVDVQSKMAKGKVVKATEDVARNFEPGAYLVRLHSQEKAAAATAGTKTAPEKKAARSAASIQKQSEGDW